MRQNVWLFSLIICGIAAGCVPVAEAPPPTTPEQCLAKFQADRRASSGHTSVRTRGELIGTAIGKGIVSGMIENRYKKCLISVGVAPETVATASGRRDARAQSASAPLQTQAHASPQSCSYTLVGGTGYVCDTSPLRRRN